MNGSPTTGPDARLARKQGRARMYAATLGVGAASVLGAVAIAATLPGSTAASAASLVSLPSFVRNRPICAYVLPPVASSAWMRM